MLNKQIIFRYCEKIKYIQGVPLALFSYDLPMSKRVEQGPYGHYIKKKVVYDLVPVLDKNNIPLMPCSEKRARQLMEKGQAKAYWQKGFFCIKLLKNPSERKYQDIALGVDPGSKREGYTIATKKAVVLNITSNTPDWVKDHIETRRNLRRQRRSRKTPYRTCRANRVSLKKENRLPPSTKARWSAKLRIIKCLLKFIPIAHINVEDIKAWTKKGQKKWNVSFSPLEQGKKWFYNEVKNLNIILSLTQGYQTKEHRTKRGFIKSSKKLDYTWEAHNVDSHSLAEIVFDTEIKPYFGLYQINFLEYHRRQLQVQNPIKGNIRKPYGTTISLNIPRGSVGRYQDKLCYIGGNSRSKVAIHSIITSKRVKQFIEKKDINILYTQNWRAQFLPRLKSWVSLRDFS